MPSSEVMHKWKHGSLHSGSKSGPLVKNRKQAIAIMMSERRAEGAHGGKYPEKKTGGRVDWNAYPRNRQAGGGLLGYLGGPSGSGLPSSNPFTWSGGQP